MWRQSKDDRLNSTRPYGLYSRFYLPTSCDQLLEINHRYSTTRALLLFGGPYMLSSKSMWQEISIFMSKSLEVTRFSIYFCKLTCWFLEYKSIRKLPELGYGKTKIIAICSMTSGVNERRARAICIRILKSVVP
jgi:hypothetical protein